MPERNLRGFLVANFAYEITSGFHDAESTASRAQTSARLLKPGFD